MLGAALNVGVTPVEAKKIVYQAVPNVGLAKVFGFLHLTNDVLIERGVTLPLPGQARTTPETRVEIGREVQATIIARDVVTRCTRRYPRTLNALRAIDEVAPA
jgi:4-carboxymuconolactone decarboxylase